MFCIPIMARHTEEALEKIEAASAWADLLELRLDLMETYDLRRMIQASGKPVLATYRSRSQGGKGSDDPGKSGEVVLNALEEGAGFVDMELRLPGEWQERIRKSRGDSKIVVSSHFFEDTPPPEDLNRVFQASVSASGDVIKIVTMAGEWEDILRVLELIPGARQQGIRIAAFCMGPMGRISRVLSHLMGGYLTFTSLGTGQESAAGQIPVEEMKALIKTFGH